MKKTIYFLLMLMAIVSLSACSSDDDDNGSSQIDKYRQTLIGRWKLTGYNISVNAYYWNKDTPVNGNFYMTLNADGSCSFSGQATYDMVADDGTKLSTGNILLSEYDVKTWSVSETSSNYDAAIIMNYYNTYQNMDSYISFATDFPSNTRIEMHQSESKDYYIFEKVN